jgi:hypothetical protein
MPDGVREFSKLVRDRLKKLSQTSRDPSSGPPLELVGEIEQELLDVCAWSFVLWGRLQRLARKLEVPR